MIRDVLIARLHEMGDSPDYQRLAADVLGIRGAPPDLARKLVAQALVVEDRRDVWRRVGERICGEAPAVPGVYILKDAGGRPLYVGKAVNLRRRLRAHFAERRWRATKSAMTRVAGAEWCEVGSELEALLREAELIDELQPEVNVQIAAPDLRVRAIPPSLIRDVIVVLPSIEDDSVELIAARADGGWMIQRTRRSGADLFVHTQRLMKFFFGTRAFRSTRVASSSARGELLSLPWGPTSTRGSRLPPLALDRRPGFAGLPSGVPLQRGCRVGGAGASLEPQALAPLVFSWLARRGAGATRLDPHHVASARELRARLAALLRDDRLFRERLEQC